MELDEKTREYFRKMGSIGGKTTLRKHGTTHFKKISGKKKLSTVSNRKGVDRKAE